MQLLGAIVAAILIVVAPAQPDLSKLTARSRTVSFETQGTTFKTAVEALADVAGVKIRWAPDVELTGRKPVYFQCIGVTFEQAFSTLMDQAPDLAYAATEETILITLNR